MQVARCFLCGYQVAEFFDSDGTPTAVSLLVEPGYWECLSSPCETQSLSWVRESHSTARLPRAPACGQCPCPRGTLGAAINQTYLVALKPPNQTVQQVTAATVEFHGEHVAFLTAEGKLAALFLLDMVQSWNVLSGK
jgi:hypothetical protein